MQIPGTAIDDFKTERKDVSPPLPYYMRLVPILFYLLIVAFVGLNGIFLLRYSQETQTRDAALARKKVLDAAIAQVQQDRANLETEAKRASDIVAWVDTTRPLQPLVVDISRSIGTEATIQELRLDRDEDSPGQILLDLKLNCRVAQQLDDTLERVAAQNYRIFSPQQTMNRDEIDYRATLMWQEPDHGVTRTFSK